eukprot:TRINITY_DN14562_c0_g1_i1.p1 TRINITY_DN14562_c0_g1~~TRINITY_DN14562_c0_g1_i1.p1  ORF type:complete len:105 (-),score=14.61 TRINITY_DN14562_c0_g1_i1:274-588(-)
MRMGRHKRKRDMTRVREAALLKQRAKTDPNAWKTFPPYMINAQWLYQYYRTSDAEKEEILLHLSTFDADQWDTARRKPSLGLVGRNSIAKLERQASELLIQRRV